MKNVIFNPITSNFDEILKSKYYVDKTDLIFELNERIGTSEKYLCVTRPRRFGKTVTINMLNEYYRYSEIKTTLFDNKIISCLQNWDQYLNKFNIIKLTMNYYFEDRTIEEGIEELKNLIIEEVECSLKKLKFTKKDFFFTLFEKIYDVTGRRIIFIIDEWDYVLRQKCDDIKAQEKYLEFLNAILKDQDYVALAYITGIIPIKKNENHSSLNNFEELSMISPGWMAEYIGFKETEVKMLCDKQKQIQLKKQSIKKLKNKKIEQFKIEKMNISKNNESKKQKLSEMKSDNKEDQNRNEIIYSKKEDIDNNDNNDELFHKNKNEEVNFDNIKKWYNGYKLKDSFLEIEYEIYTPYSIINALTSNRILNYWSNSGTFSMLTKFIDQNLTGLREDIILLMKYGTKIKIDINTYQNDMNSFKSKDDVLTLLIHLGYLGYDSDTKQIFIPNLEILNIFKYVTNDKMWNAIGNKVEKSRELLKATCECNEDLVGTLLEEYHNKADNKTYNNEASLKYAILLAYYAAKEYYNEYLELDSGKGYIGIAFIPINVNELSQHPALIIELKYGKNTNIAMEQIKKKKYFQKLERYKDNLLLVTVNYEQVDSEDENYKYHTCKIQKYKDDN
eukprot:jgi/Orpsp1_1/1190945/evm.model.d7180000082371.1